MKFVVDPLGYIVRWAGEDDSEYIEYDWVDNPECLVDNFDNFAYRWDGEKPVYVFEGYTEEQVEELRKTWCEREIESKYAASVEKKILREGMDALLGGNDATEEYIAYTEAVKSIVKESKIRSEDYGY